MIDGCEFAVMFNSEFGPRAIKRDKGNPIVWSISSRKGWAVFGKASTQGVIMPTRWTPWPMYDQIVFPSPMLEQRTNQEKIEQFAEAGQPTARSTTYEWHFEHRELGERLET